MFIDSIRYLHWGWIQVSPANLAVIGLMVLAFACAVIFRMPSGRGEDRHDHR